MSNTPSDSSYVPLDCPMCNLMIRDTRDCSQYFITGCCIDCWITFLEPLRNLNRDEGYLPTRVELEDYRKKIQDFQKMENTNA